MNKMIILEINNSFVGVMYLGYCVPPVTAQNSGYDRFLPVANDWGIIHHVPGNDPTTPG
jgi:hypothetical protein